MGKCSLETEILGQEVSFEYSAKWAGYSVFSLRLVMGWTLFQAGIVKVIDPSWTAAGYLQNAIPDGNPFMGVWMGMSGDPVTDMLVMWGLTLTGLGLMVGAFVRLSAFFGAVMMLLFWASSLQGGLLQGLPVEHGWVVDDHVVYALLLFGLGALGAGRILGVDEWLEHTPLVREHEWLKYLLG